MLLRPEYKDHFVPSTSVCHNIIKDRLPYLKSTGSLKLERKASLLPAGYLALASELFLPSSGKLWGRDVFARQSQNNCFRDQIHLWKKFLALQQSFTLKTPVLPTNLGLTQKPPLCLRLAFWTKCCTCPGPSLVNWRTDKSHTLQISMIKKTFSLNKLCLFD